MKGRKKLLGDYIDILPGFAFKTKDFLDEGVPIVKIKNITPPNVSLEDLTYVSNEIAQKSEKFMLSYNDVLIAMTGSHINQWASVVGRVARVKYKEKSLLNQRVGKIIVKDQKKANIDYIYYFLQQDETKVMLANQAGGAANQANISPLMIKRLEFPAPDIEVQNKIADILSAYDELIENNQKQVKLLEEAAQRLYKEWFVDLRFPGYEQTKIIDGVPEGWRKEQIGNICDYIRGKSYSSKEIVSDGEILMVNLKNISAYGGYSRGVEKGYCGMVNDNQLLSKGNLIMGVTDMTQERRLVGHVAIVPKLNKPAIFSMDLIKLISENHANAFLYSAFRYGGISKKISQLANGVNVLHLKPDAMMDVEIIVPDKMIELKYEKAFWNIEDKIEMLYQQIDLLVQARDRLLPKLMSGEIEV